VHPLYFGLNLIPNKLTHTTQSSEKIHIAEMHELLRNKFRNVFERNYIHLY